MAVSEPMTVKDTITLVLLGHVAKRGKLWFNNYDSYHKLDLGTWAAQAYPAPLDPATREMGPGEPPKSENVNTQYIQKVA